MLSPGPQQEGVCSARSGDGTLFRVPSLWSFAQSLAVSFSEFITVATPDIVYCIKEYSQTCCAASFQQFRPVSKGVLQAY